MNLASQIYSLQLRINGLTQEVTTFMRFLSLDPPPSVNDVFWQPEKDGVTAHFPANQRSSVSRMIDEFESCGWRVTWANNDGETLFYLSKSTFTARIACEHHLLR